MKCFYHHDKDAHVICKNCNKAICTDCTVDIRGEMYCPDCFSNLIAYQEKYLSKLKMVYILGGVIAAAVFFICWEKFWRGIASGYMVWKCSNRLICFKKCTKSIRTSFYGRIRKTIANEIRNSPYFWTNFCNNFNL